MTEDKIKPDPDETGDETETGDAAAEASSGGLRSRAAAAADGDVTRLASEAELADLSRLRMAAPRRHKSVMALVFVLLIGFIAAVVGIALGRYESEISWPGERDGAYDDARQILRVDRGVGFLIYWPNGPHNVVTGDGTNEIDVITGVGCRRDIPFHLHVTQTVLTNGLVTTTAASYADWKRARQADGWSFDASSEQVVFLNSNESGYPAWRVTYARHAGGSSLGGRALYIRHLDREIVLLREMPIVYCGRVDAMLDGYPCIAVNLDAVRARFEIPAARVPGDPSALYDGAFKAVQHHFLSSDWRLLDRTLRTLVLQAIESGDPQHLRNVRFLYSTFRLHVQNWYVRQCLAFQEKTAGDSDDRKRAAARTAIRRESARRLPDESDARQWRIAHDDWSVER